MASLPITFLSDYGYRDEFAGVCRTVIARIAPDARIVDLTHGVGRHAVAEGAGALARALPYAAPGVHLAVVDPGVGSDRSAVALRVREDDRILVGPDNGLLAPAAERLGGVAAAADISCSKFRLEPVSATFHGRDIFAPVAAHLAAGATLEEAGEAIEPDSIVRLSSTQPEVEADRVVAHVVHVDGYGNVSLDLTHEDLPRTGLRLGRPVRIGAGEGAPEAVFMVTFADVGDGGLLLYETSSRALAIAVNRGSAADELGLAPGDDVVLRPA